MKVAVSSQGPDLESPFDPRFGKAMFFAVVNTDTGQFDARDNREHLDAMLGAGIQSARHVAAMGVDSVISDNIGHRAFTALERNDVKMYVGARGSVGNAVEQFDSGQLKPLSNSDPLGSWLEVTI